MKELRQVQYRGSWRFICSECYNTPPVQWWHLKEAFQRIKTLEEQVEMLKHNMK